MRLYQERHTESFLRSDGLPKETTHNVGGGWRQFLSADRGRAVVFRNRTQGRKRPITASGTERTKRRGSTVKFCFIFGMFRSQRLMPLMGKFSVTCSGGAVCNEKSTINMLNANKVNAESSCFSHATFYVIFCDSGRILDSKIPVKYSRNREINGASAPLNQKAIAKSMTYL